MGVGGFHLARGFPPAGVVIALGLPSARPMPGPGASLRQGSSPPHPHMPHLCFLKAIFFFFLNIFVSHKYISYRNTHHVFGRKSTCWQWEQSSGYSEVRVTGCRMKCQSLGGDESDRGVGDGEASWRPSVCPPLRRGPAATPACRQVCPPLTVRDQPPPPHHTHTPEEFHTCRDTAQPF